MTDEEQLIAEDKWAITHSEQAKNFKMEGIGTCKVHGCSMWGSDKPVMSWTNDRKHKRLVVIKVCPQCHAEGIQNKGREVKQEQKNYIDTFMESKHLDIRKDIIVKYDYSDEISVTKTENMVKWISQNIGKEMKVKHLNIARYIEQTRNRFMSDEKKNEYLQQLAMIEKADLLIIDNMADFVDNDADKIINVLYNAKPGAAIMILTIPESNDRMNQLPSKLKYRFEKAQVMQMSSKAVML